jgi:hypothetical protein
MSRRSIGHNLAVESVASATQDAFWTVLLVVVIGAALVAVVTLLLTGRLYEQIGRGGLSIDEDRDPRRRPAGGSGAIAAGERDAEIRQLLTARNERRARRGEAPVDVEEELARLTAPTFDPALREEIRQLVVARNERRVRAGKEPLDVEAEIERQVRELG